MPGNLWGHALQLITWGESHGPAIGGVLDGLPPNIPLDLTQVQDALDRRRPGRNALVSPRQEPDHVEILSGFYEGKTLGTPLAFIIRNTNQKSSDYSAYKTLFRPGHADYTYWQKYGHYDHRGGGRASARETACRVAAGSIAQQVLNALLPTPLTIQAYVTQVGDLVSHHKAVDAAHLAQCTLFCPTQEFFAECTTYLERVKNEGRSVGALIEVVARNVPAGLGEPVYDKIDADLAKALMSINAVKGVDIGDGFGSIAAPVGYDEMDRPTQTQEKFLSNRAGGIVGGITTGQDIICRIALKPTSSTKQSRKTLDQQGQSRTISIEGRHDPCVGIRAVPIVEAMVALTLADHFIRWRGQCGTPHR